MRMVEHILEKEVEAVKEHVEENHEEIDLREMVQVEEERENREDLVHWLLQKEKRRQLVENGERIEELLSHLEYAYRTAAISEETYNKVKQRNQQLLENN